MGFRHRVSRATVCPLGQPDTAIGLESQIEPWLPKITLLEVPACSAVATRNRMRNVPAVTTKTPACSPGAGARCQKNAPLLAEGEVFFLDIPVHRTPFWPAFSRPKFFGVAPARHGYTVTVFCPRAYKDVSNLESRAVSIPNLERSNHQWQY